MISEKELADLSYSEAPNIITGKIPGSKSQKILEENPNYESMARGAGRFPLVLDEGLGDTVKDVDGNIYIDMAAGVAVNVVGRRHPKVVEAIVRQTGKLLHSVEMASTNRAELARRISSIMPEGLRGNCVSYFTQDGSGAVDTAIKFARRITGRSQIIAFHGGYHGVWCGSGALTAGDHYRHGFGPLMPYVIHVPYPYCYRCCFNMEYPSCGLQCAKYVDYVLNTPYTAADDVAAVIVEPQQGEGGYIAPPPEYFKVLKEACEKHGALFIADEIQSGAGRSGKMWAIEHSGVSPDMVTWGKGMGGDLPMAGVTFRADLAGKIEDGSQPNTFAANALSAAVCMTNIDILTDENSDLIGRAGQLGEEVKAKLEEEAKNSRFIGDVRGRGLFIGVELVKDKETREPLEGNVVGDIVSRLLNSGVIMVPCGRYGNVLRLMPPLTITREHMQKGLDTMMSVVKNVESVAK